MSLPFEIKELPKAIQVAVKQAIKKQDYGPALSKMDPYLEAGGERSASLLIAVAYFEIEYACAVMVSEGLPRSTRALELLAEAISLGADKNELTTITSRCRRIKAAEEAEQDRVDALLARDPAELRVREIKDVAYRLAEKGGKSNHLRAAELWRLAAEKEDHVKTKHDYRLEVGYALADAGNWTEALPILDFAVQFGIDNPEEAWATNPIDRALDYLVQYAIDHNDALAYVATWRRADEWTKLDKQSEYEPKVKDWQRHLAACLHFNLPEYAQRVLIHIEEVNRNFGHPHESIQKSAELRKLIAQAKKLVKAGKRGDSAQK